jgi:hypothetical protein
MMKTYDGDTRREREPMTLWGGWLACAADAVSVSPAVARAGPIGWMRAETWLGSAWARELNPSQLQEGKRQPFGVLGNILGEQVQQVPAVAALAKGLRAFTQLIVT